MEKELAVIQELKNLQKVAAKIDKQGELSDYLSLDIVAYYPDSIWQKIRKVWHKKCSQALVEMIEALQFEGAQAKDVACIKNIVFSLMS